MNILNIRFLQIVYGLFATSIYFSTYAMMDNYKVGSIHAWEAYDEDKGNLVRFYNQKLENDKYLVVKEIIRGSDEGKKSVAVILMIPDLPHMVLRCFNQDDVAAIAAEITRKFVLQKKDIFFFDE